MMKKSHIKRILSLILALILSFSLCIPAVAAGGFSDVPATHWAYQDIMACAEMGAVSGVGDGKFDPEGIVTSAQFVVMLTRTFYSSDVAAAQGAGGAWYAPNVQAANAHDLLTYWTSQTVEVNDNAINRNSMAVVLSNIMNDFGKSASDSEKAGVESQIADWQNVSAFFRREVSNCYARGILTGMSDGKFSGYSTMTRAQACAVINRLSKLINGAEPAAPTQPETPETPTTPTQPEQPAQPEQPQQPETPTQSEPGKLANGQDATVENVQAILDDIQSKYPTGTIWGDRTTPNTNTYAKGTYSADINAIPELIAVNLSTVYACGGWAAMVSDAIFGQSGAPARRVSKTSDLRPGDIVITMNNKTNKMTHVAIFTGISASGNIVTCDGNAAGTVLWGGSSRNLENLTGSAHAIAYTRYPE